VAHSRPSAHFEALDSTEHIPWDAFTKRTFRLKPGQHVGVIGPTGQGKTTLVINILPMMPYVTVFGFKPRDKTLDQLMRRNGVGGGRYARIPRWVNRDADLMPRRVLWPDMTRLDATRHNRGHYLRALEEIYLDGAWSLYLDDLWYMANHLKLDHEVKVYLTMFRSLEGNLIVSSQRPSWIPLEVFDQSTHLFFLRDNDETNLKRISGISYRSARVVRDTVANLEEFECLYVNTRTGFMCRTRAPYVGPTD